MADQQPDPTPIQRLSELLRAIAPETFAQDEQAAAASVQPETPWPVLETSPLEPAPEPEPPPLPEVELEPDPPWPVLETSPLAPEPPSEPVLAPEPPELPQAPVQAPTLPDISINAKVYPCDEWALVEEGERLEQVWDKGFAGGSGRYVYRGRDDECFRNYGCDTTSPPLIRLRPALAATISAANVDTAQPVYAFLVQSSGGTNFVYILNDRRGYKIKVSDSSLEDTHDFGANAVCGRPALFEGNWYIPLGASVDAVELTTIADSGGDTFNTLNVNALAFANLMKDGIAQLARAHTTNLVDLTAAVTRAASDWTADDFEVGDSSLPITDMLTWMNELAVIKPDSPYRFDGDGSAFAIQQFVGRSASPTTTFPGESFVYGPYLYWLHTSGLWRIVDDAATPVDPEAARDYVMTDIGGIAGDRQRWRSFTALGRWAYLQGTNDGYLGYIQSDGTILWYGRVLNEIGTNIHSVLTEGGTNGAAILWMLGATTLYRINLDADGSPRTELTLATHARGEASTQFSLYTPNTDLGNGSLLTKQKQARKLWVITENMGATTPLTMRVIRDRDGTLLTIGNNITTDGYHERTWTPGTSDLFYEIMVGVRFDTTGGYSTNSDPRIRAFGIEAVTASVYRAVIPLVPGRIAGNRGIRQMLKDLRDLKNGKTITIRDPENPNSPFNAQIVSVAEEAVPLGQGQVGYLVQIHLERYDWADGV